MVNVSTIRGSFGSVTTRVSIAPGYDFVLITAKEGIFKGLSTMIAANGVAFAKLIYSESLRKTDRQQFHEKIAADFVEAIDRGDDIKDVIGVISTKYKENGALKELIHTLE